MLGILHLWPDEKLDLRIKHTIKTWSYSKDSPETSYFLYGLEAPAGEDPILYGRYRVDTYNGTGTLPAINNPLEISMSDTCELRTGCSADSWMRSLENVSILLEANSEMLQRYESLSRYKRFSEAVSPAVTSPVPNFTPIIKINQL